MSADFYLPPLIFEKQLKPVKGLNEYFQDKNVWIIGGTGIVGTWLTSRILFESRKYNLNTRIWISTRNVARAKRKFHLYTNKHINFLKIDKFDLEAPNTKVDLIIFGATPSGPIYDQKEIEYVVQTNRNFVNRIKIQYADQDNPLKVLNISSGAAISRETKIGGFIPEIRPNHHDVSTSQNDWYSNLKRDIELEFLGEVKRGEFSVTNARLFNITGYGLPLDSHFAWAQFMKSCLNRFPPKISGNPNTERSFLSLAEASSALLHCVLGSFEIVNVGGAERVSMQTLESKFCEHFNLKSSGIGNEEILASSYVPELNNLSALGFFQGHNTDIQIAQHHKFITDMQLI